MLLRSLTATALVIGAASAFKDASPFALFSTSQLPADSQPGPHVASADQIDNYITYSLQGCPTDSYIVVNQPGLSSASLSSRQIPPHMKRWLSGDDKTIKSLTSVRNVKGTVTTANVASFLQKQCSTVLVEAEDGVIPSHTSSPQVITVDFSKAGVPSSATLSKHDSYLNALLSSLPNQSYTVIYLTSPPAVDVAAELVETDHSGTGPSYEMDEPYPSAMHIDLKRDLYAHAKGKNSTSNLDSKLPLFEKYQFLSSGIFMGGTVALLLLMILYVGISAISGLEVSYMAFSKEMGPAAQKKQQQ